VTAIDIDPLAVDAARRNVQANGLGNADVREGTISAAPGRFDLIAANLFAETLAGMAGELASHLNPGGTAILSGMLAGQEGPVITGLAEAGLILKEVASDEKWVTLVFTS
jgi:ribosomal protein L11 methyltransferase